MKLKGHQVKTAEVIEFRNFSKIWRTNYVNKIFGFEKIPQ